MRFSKPQLSPGPERPLQHSFCGQEPSIFEHRAQRQLRWGTVLPSGILPDLKTPTVESWALKIDQQLSPATSLGSATLDRLDVHRPNAWCARTNWFPEYPVERQPSNLPRS